MTEALVPALNPITSSQRSALAAQTKRNIIFYLCIDIMKLIQHAATKRPQNVLDKLKPLTLAVAFSGTQLY